MGQSKLKLVPKSAKLTFVGLVLLFPLFIAICLAIYVDDLGPTFLVKKESGKTGIIIHKFRSMKMSAHEDVSTHQLSNLEQYITKSVDF
ncbi:hypothetical protein FMM80_05375 [Schaedlerella arabinosiphila]|uniref:Bacterial sugar transferase domain-containing protein n=1 Tax=Schaedlerella arabinosiphila TaxID=2044587 RepID=A0A9X5H6H7_9FIRM|nr:hypothetical protein [Schaedlerella arabinosiphila]